jgi:hypothetical protein
MAGSSITGLRICKLRRLALELEWPRCSEDDIHTHHFWNTKGVKGDKAKEIKHVIEVLYPWVFLHDVCATHNVERYADTEAARKVLIRSVLDIHPIDHVEEAFKELRRIYTSPPDQLRLERYL